MALHDSDRNFLSSHYVQSLDGISIARLLPSRSLQIHTQRAQVYDSIPVLILDSLNLFVVSVH